MKYHLSIAEHPEFGGYGIVVKGQRSYFEPAMEGLQLAHDLLEHTVTPHTCGFTDELMALGAIMAGRVDRHRNSSGRGVNHEDIQSDVMSLARSSLWTEGGFDVGLCHSRLTDRALMASLTEIVRQGLLEAVNEYEGAAHSHLPGKYDFDIGSIVGHMVRGYQQFRKRFPDLCLFDSLFHDITREANAWLATADPDETATLTVVLSTRQVDLERYDDTPYD
jgi:hypothetical protein